MKGKSKRIVSGFLSALTIISSIMQPVTTYAAEAEPAAYEAEYPDMEKVKGALAEDEIVTAEDYEVEAGTGFDVKSDFSGMKIHPEKVKVTYHEAKNQNGQAFDGNKADTYHAVYFVEPVSGHPSYHVQRNIVVREPSAEIHKEKNAQDSDGNDQTGGEDAEEGETDSHKKKLSETELNQALEALKGQDTYDEESGLKLLDVMEQFKNHMIAGNVDLLALEEGETVTFTAYNPKMLRSSQVEVSSGGWYYYADYGLGSYLTCPFTVKFGSVTATAYCIQPSKPGPGSGVYEITKLGDGKELSKVCYYGTNASGEDCFFDKKYPDFSAGKRFVVTHLAASYAEGSEDAFYGANDTGIALAKELYSYAVSQPEIPDAAMAFSDDKVTAYVDGNIQRTKEVTFQADSRQSITMKLPKGVKFHNVSTGKISNAGADVVVKGGTTFFLSAPLTQTEDVGQNWSAKMKGSITKDYSAYKITTGSDTQNLALVFGEGIEEETTASFQVTWLELAKVQVVKVDSEKEDTLIDYPVMYHPEEVNYYLKRDFFREYSANGSLFLSENCSLKDCDNLIIYGHHMNSGKMFAALEGYRERKFFKEHPFIFFNTLQGEEKYQVFAVFSTPVYTGSDFAYYTFTKAENRKSYETFIEAVKERSFYDTGITADYGEKLLTLSTCEYSQENGRLVVVAKKIAEKEITK